MNRSTELKRLVIQLYEALSNEKAAEVAENLFSKEAGFLALGSGPNEWMNDAEVVRRGYQERARAGGSEVRILKMEA